MGQSCLFSFIGVMWIILCHFCTSPNTKISATISHTSKNCITYLFQRVLKLNISRALQMIPKYEEFITREKSLGKYMYVLFIFFFPLQNFFFANSYLPSP